MTRPGHERIYQEDAHARRRGPIPGPRHRVRPHSILADAVAAGQRAGLDDLINFSIGDPDITTDQRITRAAMDDALAGHTHYTAPHGDPELVAAIVEAQRADYGVDVEPGQVLVTASACHAMALACMAVLDPDLPPARRREVIVPEPYFNCYDGQIEQAGGVPVHVPTSEADGFQLRPEALEAAITPRTRAIILNTPTNPSGVCWSREAQLVIARVAAEHDLLVLADDIYTAFSYAEPFIPFATLPGMAERTVTVRSFSKNYAMTGWRIGYAMGPAPIIGAMTDINENIVYTAPAPSQRAALAAIRLRHEIMPPIAELYRSRLMAAYREICDTPRMHALEPGGAIYLWVNIADTGLSSAEVMDAMLHQAHVLTIPGPAFGASGEGYLRLAATLDVKRIHEAFARIRRMAIFGG
ncbi:aminotransferase class I/II-fold pyridoxal phosphate-dependent enzyme [Acidipropionibacterium acidipropionici]|uniref:aminotransferase class I/II-fold pyridoxal phosphate-dependent enzyme n=1 Tax=Acidipropionibacterium acidipropionici TaxID=1748 RepID=UPI001C305821|nr:aminotransferase class I/II-fold pyridoxal phosphate-dependent enzyme [Acidipropionibacterium acidipropionici]